MNRGGISVMNKHLRVGMAISMVGFLSVLLMPGTAVTPLTPDYTKAGVVGMPLSIGSFAGLWGDQPIFSEETLAALTVYLEARGESFAGKLAVAAVIRNRMKLRYQSDGTIKGTVLKPRQFQPWNFKSPHQVRFDLRNKEMRDSLLAWRLVQDGRKIVDGAVLFYNPNLVRTPYWAKVSQKVATIGGHEFYIPSNRQV